MIELIYIFDISSQIYFTIKIGIPVGDIFPLLSSFNDVPIRYQCITELHYSFCYSNFCLKVSVYESIPIKIVSIGIDKDGIIY
jgi:hypothetical protein